MYAVSQKDVTAGGKTVTTTSLKFGADNNNGAFITGHDPRRKRGGSFLLPLDEAYAFKDRQDNLQADRTAVHGSKVHILSEQ